LFQEIQGKNNVPPGEDLADWDCVLPWAGKGTKIKRGTGARIPQSGVGRRILGGEAVVLKTLCQEKKPKRHRPFCAALPPLTSDSKGRLGKGEGF